MQQRTWLILLLTLALSGIIILHNTHTVHQRRLEALQKRTNKPPPPCPTAAPPCTPCPKDPTDQDPSPSDHASCPSCPSCPSASPSPSSEDLQLCNQALEAANARTKRIQSKLDAEHRASDAQSHCHGLDLWQGNYMYLDALLRALDRKQLLDAIHTAFTTRTVHTHTHPQWDANKDHPIVALLVPMTLRGFPLDADVSTLPLIRHYLPSLVSTVSPSFRYRVYIGLDDQDPLVGSNHQDALRRMADAATQVLATAAQPFELRIISLDNPLGFPTVVWLSLGRTAYHDGAHYMYTQSDDLELGTKDWTAPMVAALRDNPVHPNLGMVMPQDTDHGPSDDFQTYNFMHRTHFDIFHGAMYPLFIKNLRVDQFASHLYKPFNSAFFKLRIIVRNHMGVDVGSRYQGLDYPDEYLQLQLQKDRATIQAWLAAHK